MTQPLDLSVSPVHSCLAETAGRSLSRA